jgi:hypothetical protein
MSVMYVVKCLVVAHRFHLRPQFQNLMRSAMLDSGDAKPQDLAVDFLMMVVTCFLHLQCDQN